MKKRNIIAALTLTLALGVGATAYASTAAPQNTTTTNTTTSSFRRMGFGRMLGSNGYDMMTSILKNKLGMTDAQVEEALKSGKTMWEIASEKGMSEEDFRNAMVEEKTKLIDEGIKNGTITKEEGDQLKENLKNNIESCPGVGSRSQNGFGGMMGRGNGNRGGRGCR